MKRLIAAAALAAIILISCISGSMLVGKNCEYINGLVTDCENSYKQNRNEAVQLSEKLEKEWQSKETLMSAYSTRGYIEDIKISIAKLAPYAESDKENDFLSECKTIKIMLSQIKDDQTISLQSFL